MRGELARMHEAYELRCNRHVMACRSQGRLVAQLLQQLTIGLGDADLEHFLVPDLAELCAGSRENFARGSICRH